MTLRSDLIAANVIELIANGRYTNNVPYSILKPAHNDDMTVRDIRELDADYNRRKREQRTAHGTEERRLMALFQSDLEIEHGLVGHPKAAHVFDLAWDHGHSEGLESVANWYAELSSLVLP